MTVETYDVEALLIKLSDFGKYQKRNFFFISLAIIFSAVQYSYIFTTRNTNYRCFVEECEVNANVTYEVPWLHEAIPFDGTTPRKCERFAASHGKNLTREKNTCNRDFFNQTVTETCKKFVFENGPETIERDFELTCDENLWKLTILGSLDEFAEVLFLPILGYLSDQYGRRTMMVICLVLTSIAGTIKSFSTSYVYFAFMEFLSALCTSGIYSSGFVLGVELLMAENRVLGSTIIAMAFPLGEIALGLAAWYTPSWRFMLRVLYAPGILFVTYFYCMDESVRFLITNGNDQKAKEVLKHIANVNRVEIPEDIKIRPVEHETSKPIKKESLAQVLCYPRLVLRILNCSFSWISCTFVFYGLTIYSVSLTGNVYLNFIIMAIIELPAYVICYYTLDKFGRRLSLAVPLLLSGIACLCYIFVPEDETTYRLVLPIIGKFAATMGFKTIYIYTAEMFPTTLRHSLLGLCSMFGRAGSIGAPQLPLLARITPSLPLLLFGGLAITSGLTSFFLPETNGRKLPDTIEDALHIDKSTNKII